MDNQTLIPQNPNRRCMECGYLNLSDATVCSNCLRTLPEHISLSRGTRELPELLEEEHRRTRLHPLGKQLQERMSSIKADATPDQPMPYQMGKKVILEIFADTASHVILPNQLVQPYTLGRRDNVNGNTPSLDLDGYGGYKLGVSRTHACLKLEQGRLVVIDLGSVNGTFVNGRRILAQNPHPLHHGDRLGIGQLVCVVTFSL
ncbi:MAG: FHA domain-containing protein [Phototrophicaceae bacterium]